MTNIRRGQKGFTLLEIIVVLAVIGSLAAMLAPVVFRYIDDAKRQQAQSDVNMIAASINQMYKDTGRYPFSKAGAGPNKFDGATDASVLVSQDETGACVPAATLLVTCTSAPAATAAGWDAGFTDSLKNQLVLNTPKPGGTAGTAYPVTGQRKWNGPYLERPSFTDPWNRPYLVNILNAAPAEESSASQKWVIVLSAGGNGIIDTVGTAPITATVAPGGDDIIARVK